MKFLVIEDQVLVRDLLSWACQSTFEKSEVAQAVDGTTAIEQCEAVLPDIIILDLELPGQDGLDLLPKLHAIVPKAKVIILSSHVDDLTVHRVFQAKINGFVDKNSQPMERLKEAVQTVMDGNRYLSPVVREVWRRLREAPAAFNKILSDREQEVLGLIGQGLTNSEIAEIVGLRPVTIQNHRANIMTKLDIHSTSNLILYANEKGFTRIYATFGREGAEKA